MKKTSITFRKPAIRQINRKSSKNYTKPQNINVLVSKFQITCLPKLVETVSIIQ